MNYRTLTIIVLFIIALVMQLASGSIKAPRNPGNAKGQLCWYNPPAIAPEIRSEKQDLQTTIAALPPLRINGMEIVTAR